MKSRRPLSSLALATLAVLVPCSVLTAQEPVPVDSFGEEISVDVVGLPVWVTDREGHPVTGLDRDDFELLQDGKPVDLVNFVLVDDARADRPWTETTSSGSEAVGYRPADAPALGGEDAVHLAILIDDWNLRPEDRARVLRGLREYLEHGVQPGDRVSLMVHSRSTRLIAPFTDDRARLEQALDDVEAAATSAVTLASERTQAFDLVQDAYQTYFTHGADPEVACRVSAGWGAMESAAREYAAAVQTHVGASATAVATAAHHLAGLPGHRVLLYVGGGLPQTAGIEVFQLMGDVCPSRSSELGFFHVDYDMTWLYQEVADRANADGVTLYALEASSPTLDLGFDSVHTGGAVTSGSPTRPGHPAGTGRGETGYLPTFRPSVAGQRQRLADEEGALVLLARETGGRAFLSPVEIADDLARIADELRTYYSLGFRPRGLRDGGLHGIEARLVGHEGYRIRYRQAYRDKAPEQLMAERVMAMAHFGAGANPLDVRMEVGAAVPEDRTGRVPVRIWVPLTALTLVPGTEAGELQGRLQVLMAATGSGGDLGPVRQKLIPVRVHPGEAGVAGDQLVEVALEASPGRNYVALAVRDDLGGEVSYLRRGFWLPEEGRVAMSLAD